MDLISESNINIKLSFPSGIRGDIMDSELLNKMKKAGVYNLWVGIESADDEIQKKINKKLKLDKVVETINEADKLGIITGAHFMIGFPNETREQMERTIEFARNSNLIFANFSKVNPFVNTELFNSLTDEQKEIIRKADPMDFDFRFLRINISTVTAKELDNITKKAYYRFYLKPSRIFRLLKIFPNKKELIRHALRLVLWRD